FRKIARDRGTAVGHVAAQIKKFLDNDASGGALSAERELLATALADVEAMIATCFDHLLAAQEDPKRLYSIGLASVRVLMGFGDLVMGWRLLEGAEVAQNALEGASAEDKDFYAGKIAAAKWVAHNELPLLTAPRGIVAGTDAELMALDESAFCSGGAPAPRRPRATETRSATHTGGGSRLFQGRYRSSGPLRAYWHARTADLRGRGRPVRT